MKHFQRVPLPSRFLKLSGIATFETCVELDEFQCLYSDLWDKCEEFGVVVSVKIPRPKFVDRSEANR